MMSRAKYKVIIGIVSVVIHSYYHHSIVVITMIAQAGEWATKPSSSSSGRTHAALSSPGCCHHFITIVIIMIITIIQIRNPNGGSAVELSHNHLQRILAETSQPTSMVRIVWWWWGWQGGHRGDCVVMLVKTAWKSYDDVLTTKMMMPMLVRWCWINDQWSSGDASNGWSSSYVFGSLHRHWHRVPSDQVKLSSFIVCPKMMAIGWWS